MAGRYLVLAQQASPFSHAKMPNLYSQPTVLSAAIAIVSATEAQVIGRSYHAHAWVAWLQRVILFPLRFLKRGAMQHKRALSSYTSLVAGASFPALWLAQQMSLPLQAHMLLPVLLVVIPAVLVIFAMPSQYMDAGLNNTTCAFAAERVITSGYTEPAQRQALQGVIAVLEVEARRRVTSLKWFVGLTWAGLLYFTAQLFERTPQAPDEFISSALSITTVAFVVVAVYWCVWSYDAAVTILFRSIDVAFQEVAARPDSTARPQEERSVQRLAGGISASRRAYPSCKS